MNLITEWKTVTSIKSNQDWTDLGVNSILEFKLMGNSNSNSAFFNGIDQIGIEGWYRKLNPQVNLPVNFLIQKHFFHNNPTWNINYSE